MDTQTQHTPGPWVDTNVIDKHGSTMLVDSAGLPVAVINASVANTRLLTAAPELLEALKRMTNQFLTQIQFNPHGGNADIFHTCLSDARAAIEKAEGTK